MTTYSLFYPDTAPANVAADPAAVSLGTAFKLSITGWVTGVRFWKSPTDAGPWDVYLYDYGSLEVLAYKNVPVATDGWNTVLFDTAYETVVSTIPYLAAFHTDTGNYGYTQHVFDSDVTVGPIIVPNQPSAGNGNGTFGYGAGGSGAAAPTGSFNSAWYGIEPIFTDTDPTLTSIDGSLTVTEQSDTIVGAAVLPIVAGLTATEASDALTASTGDIITAALAAVEQSDTASASVVLVIIAALTVTEGSDTLSAGVGNLTTGSLTIIEQSDVVAAIGTIQLFEVIAASLIVTDSDDGLSATARVTTISSRPTLSEIIPLVLNDLVGNRVWQMATPDNLPRGSDGVILPFILWHRVGGRDQEFIDSTMPTHRHARIQVQSCAPSGIAADTLHEAVCQALLASAYTVGVLGSPVGTYDADRKLHAPWQQFSIWFQPTT